MQQTVGEKINARIWQTMDQADEALLDGFRRHLRKLRQAGRTLDQRETLREYFRFHAPLLTPDQIEAEVDQAMREGAELRRSFLD